MSANAEKTGADTPSRFWGILPFVVGVVCYLLGVAPHSFHPSDDGWVLAMSYRMVQGDVPYRDFLFAMPPASPYLHTIWLAFPDHLQFMAARCSFYAWYLAMPALLFVFAYPRCFGAGRHVLAGAACLTAVAWVYAIHYFPPVPWPTVDGMLFATAALALLVASIGRSGRTRAGLCIAAGLAAGIAPLTKQSYVPFLAFFQAASVLAACERTAEGRLRFDFIMAVRLVAWSLAPIALVIAYLDHVGALNLAITQIFGASTSKGLHDALIRPYQYGSQARHIKLYFEYGFLLGCLGSVERRFAGIDLRTIPYLGFLALLLWNLRHFMDLGGIAGCYAVFAAVASFVLTRLVFLELSGQLSKELAILSLGTLAIALSAQISWGYRVPILGFTGIGFTLAALTRPPDQIESRWKLGVITVLPSALALYFGIGLAQANTYRDIPTDDQQYNLQTLNERFYPGITTGEPNYRRMRSLLELSAQLDRDFPTRQQVVITEAPLFYFLRHKHNPSALDWWLPEESANQAGTLMVTLRRPDIVAIARRNYTPAIPPDPRDRFFELLRKQCTIVRSVGSYDAYIYRPKR